MIACVHACMILSVSAVFACIHAGVHAYKLTCVHAHIRTVGEFGYYLTGIAFMGGCLSGVTGPNVKAVLLNCNTPATRGRCVSEHTWCMHAPVCMHACTMGKE